MNLFQKRLGGDNTTTISALYLNEGAARYLFCFMIEDEFRAVKKAGETRIPAGRYEITLNTIGGMNARYNKYPWHRGMLEIQGVAGFDYIYIHTGNDDEDTEGCLLPNYKADIDKMRGENSFECYKDLYLEIVSAIKCDEKVFITIEDEGF